MSSMSVIIRPVSTVCNLSCYYCYNKIELLPKPDRFMKIDVLQQVIQNVINSGRKTIKFLWHGGEPMIAGLDFYRKAVEFQKNSVARLPYPVTVTNTIQTNGLLVDEGKVNFFILNKFRFGVSVDGPDYVHNHNRYDSFGRGSHNNVLEKIRMLKRMGGECGIVSVITTKSLPHAKEIFDFLVSEKLFNAHFSPYVEINPTTGKINERSITAEEFGGFIIQVFQEWKLLKNPQVKIRIIDNFLQGLLGGRVELCTFARNCSHHLLIEANGDVFICGRNANNRKFYAGNAAYTAINNIIASREFQEITNQMSRIPASCEKCKWFTVCKGGCDRYRRIICDDFETNADYFCKGYGMIFTEIENWLRAEGVRPNLVKS